MQPPEPGTSLDLTSTSGDDSPAAPAASTDLELPPSAAPPIPVEAPPPTPVEAPKPLEAPTPLEGAQRATPGPLGNLVVAHFRRVEIAMLGRVLITTLGGALPASMIRLERRRSLGRFVGRAGEPIGITVTAGERTLSFRAPELGVVEATVGHTVRGVTLSTTSVPIARWLDELGELLDQVTLADEVTRTALERALLSS